MRGYFPQFDSDGSNQSAQYSVRHRLTPRSYYEEERELAQLNHFDLAELLSNTVPEPIMIEAYPATSGILCAKYPSSCYATR
jgi:hypothetical protein